MMDRLLPPNFRDLGGLTGFGGRRVKFGRLLRSGALSGLSQEAMRNLRKEYNLKTVVDLRGDYERSTLPDPIPEDVEYIALDLLQNTSVNHINLDHVQSIPDDEMIDNYMLDIYRNMMTDHTSCKYLSELISILLQHEEGAILFHCYAGKDRTGIAAALILSALGVSRDEIIAEYLLTNQFYKSSNETILARATVNGATKHQLAYIKATLEANPEYLFAAFGKVTTEKTIDRFIFETLEITEAKKERLHYLYLE